MGKKDSLWMSLAWGRVGGAAFVLLSFLLQQFGVEFSADEQATVFDAIGRMIKDFGMLVGVVTALVSKYRESNKLALPKMLWVFFLVIPMATSSMVFTGCTYKPAYKQISAQTEDSFTKHKAAYLDARIWYNKSRSTFNRRFDSFTAGQVQTYAGSLDDVGKALDAWGLIIKGGKIGTHQQGVYNDAYDTLIDLGFQLLIE